METSGGETWAGRDGSSGSSGSSGCRLSILEEVGQSGHRGIPASTTGDATRRWKSNDKPLRVECHSLKFCQFPSVLRSTRNVRTPNRGHLFPNTFTCANHLAGYFILAFYNSKRQQNNDVTMSQVCSSFYIFVRGKSNRAWMTKNSPYESLSDDCYWLTVANRTITTRNNLRVSRRSFLIKTECHSPLSSEQIHVSCQQPMLASSC